MVPWSNPFQCTRDIRAAIRVHEQWLVAAENPTSAEAEDELFRAPLEVPTQPRVSMPLGVARIADYAADPPHPEWMVDNCSRYTWFWVGRPPPEPWFD